MIIFELILIFVLISLIFVARKVFEKYTLPQPSTKQYIAVKQTKIDSIYGGGPPVYFGPFNSVEQLYKWSDKTNLTVTAVELKTPDQWSQLKYYDRW